MAYIANHFMEVWGKGYAHRSVKGRCSFPFISITSHHNSSPTEVATVPLAIKIMLGHAMLVCDSTVGNKSSGSGHNDANSWVVNLEQCRWKPSLWFLRETESRPCLHLSVWTLLDEYQTKKQQEMAASHLCLLYHFWFTATIHKRRAGFFFTLS